MSSAWKFQEPEDIRKHGEEKAPWHVGWYEPDGHRRKKSFGVGSVAIRNAEKFRRKIEGQLAAGVYRGQLNKTWADFRAELEAKIFDVMAPSTRRLTRDAMEHFGRIVKPLKVNCVGSQDFADYISARRKERGKKRGSCVSPFTINKELRHLKAVLKIAVDWGYLPTVPRFKMLREPQALPTYVTGDHFAVIYRTCDTATMPEDLPNVTTAEWWQALLVTGYMTGWRISEILSLRRDDLDGDGAYAVTRYEDNKGKRDERVKLHPVVVEHLKKLAGFGPVVFPWNHDERTLYTEFARIQEAAGIHLPCRIREEHEHSRFCYVYGFHDLRRAFATMNADKLTPDALQTLMRHKSYLTTQKYINMARQMDAAVASLYVPDVLVKSLGQ